MLLAVPYHAAPLRYNRGVKRIIEIILSAAVICVLAFLITYGAFFYIKERNCATSIYYSGCYLTYPKFLEMLGHGSFSNL